MDNYDCTDILRRDNNFNEYDFGEVLRQNKGTEFMAMPQYRYILLQKRAVENENYIVNKDNFERLFLESFTDGQYKRLLKRMEYNGWTAEELFREVVKTGASADAESAIKFNS